MTTDDLREKVAKWFIRETITADTEAEAQAIVERMWSNPGKSRSDAEDKTDRILSLLAEAQREEGAVYLDSVIAEFKQDFPTDDQYTLGWRRGWRDATEVLRRYPGSRQGGV